MNKKELKKLEKYLTKRQEKILEARSKVMDAGGIYPGCLYISDSFLQEEDKLRVNLHLYSPEATIFGMRIFIDFRVPPEHFYITSSPLEAPNGRK